MAPLWIRVMQFISISLMWVFTFGIMVLVPWLVFVAARWQDALNWSLVISLVYLPVYFTVAATLTYAYFGLQRGAPKDGPPPDEKPGP